ncbi:GAF domain-containing protein [soil metagenome]
MAALSLRFRRSPKGRANFRALMLEPLLLTADGTLRAARYREVSASVALLLEEQNGQRDWVAAMATVACELHGAFAYYDWTGFYRAVKTDMLLIGPYQGGHGCLSLAFSRGVCGACARTKTTQLVRDVAAFPGHIACSNTTQSELVVPVLTPSGRLLAVIDVDSNAPAAFTEVDARGLEAIAAELGRLFAEVERP